MTLNNKPDHQRQSITIHHDLNHEKLEYEVLK